MHRFPPELLDLIGSYLEYFEASEISSHAAKSIVAINIQSVWKAIYRWIGTGNLERIKAAYAEVNFKPSKSLMKAAVEHGKLEIVKYFFLRISLKVAEVLPWIQLLLVAISAYSSTCIRMAALLARKEP